VVVVVAVVASTDDVSASSPWYEQYWYVLAVAALLLAITAIWIVRRRLKYIHDYNKGKRRHPSISLLSLDHLLTH
jgi:hypothetical protein